MKDLLKGILALGLLIFVVWAILSGADSMLILFGLFVGALLLKCMR
jgi:hypothetical protein